MQSISSSAQSMIACTCIGTGLRAVQARAIHTTARRWKGKDAEVVEAGAEGDAAAATTADSQASYPFSDSVILTSRPILPKSQSEPYSTMDRVNRSLILPSTENFRTMFSRRSKDRVQPGSIISVESYTGATPGASTSTSAFAGVLMAVKHRHQGVDNAIRVRASVGKPGVGTEVRFDVNSPWIKDIRVLRKNEGMRQAKLYYIRRSDKFLSGVQPAIRSSMVANAKLTNDTKAVSKAGSPSKAGSKKKSK